MLRALIVEDDVNTSRAMAGLVAEAGFEVTTAGSLREARERLSGLLPDIVLMDLDLPDGSGFDLIRELVDQTEAVDVVVTTGFANVDSVVEALRQGAVDFLTKPVDVSRLRALLKNTVRSREVGRKVQALGTRLDELGRFGPMIGTSPSMQAIYDLVSRVAPTDATVLIAGESGTGKELVAEAVHRLSRRSSKPFVVINCGAIAATLIESELFGHERGSFTGAERTHRGVFERAQGGTLFLDEIGEMPLELQVKLLRVLESGTLQRVGGDRTIEIDVRILAATNRDLEAAAEGGTFRSDLLYRLKVFPLTLPPLNERGDDVQALAIFFLGQLNKLEGAQKAFTAKALDAIGRYRWPGNVRELRNAVQRAFIVAENEIDVDSLALNPERTAVRGQDRLTMTPMMSLSEVEKRLILASLEHFNGDKRKAAESLGVSIKTLYNRINQYGSE